MHWLLLHYMAELWLEIQSALFSHFCPSEEEDLRCRCPRQILYLKCIYKRDLYCIFLVEVER